jgi:hypothetical protein
VEDIIIHNDAEENATWGDGINVEDVIAQEDAENATWGDDRDDDGWINWEEEFRQLMLTRREPPATHPVYKFMDKVIENIDRIFFCML